jgi:uncharacterized membrane protein AbrB (regulator of aidB expression)
MPGDSFTPLLLSLALAGLFSGMLLKEWWLIGASGVAVLVFMLLWLWPRPALAQTREAPHG